MRYNSYPAADLIGDADPKSHVLRQMIAKLQENRPQGAAPRASCWNGLI